VPPNKGFVFDCILRALGVRKKSFDPLAHGRMLKRPYAEPVFELIGFTKADQLANRLEVWDPEGRVDAAICAVLHNASKQGHCFLPVDELRKKTLDFGCSEEEIEASCERIEGRLVRTVRDPELGPIVYRSYFYKYETIVADALVELSGPRLSGKNWEAPPSEEEEKEVDMPQHTPGQDQLDALHKVLENRVSVVTGGPGTGKSVLMYWAKTAFENDGHDVTLLAPTGRAAARLRMVCHATSADAHTIHSWIARNRYRKKKKTNSYGSRPPPVFILDECSMVDMELLHAFVELVRSRNPILVFCGDVDQLPSIGAGNVLGDLIDSGAIPVARLTEVRRQEHGSRVLPIARAIRSGDVALLKPHVCPETFRISQDESETFRWVMDRCEKIYRESYENLDMLPQVISPCKLGILGTENLNNELQRRLNRRNLSIQARCCTIYGTTFAQGDRVIACKNDPERNVCNGDQGRIVEICDVVEENPQGKSRRQKYVTVEYSDTKNQISYRLGDQGLDDLALAYAITVHKTQGSEFSQDVIILLPSRAWMMAERRLLYTAVTRAKRNCLIAGQKDMLRRSMENTGSRRNTRLEALLREALEARTPVRAA
jgi:exodeoxyribonuclease V alpha subunit